MNYFAIIRVERGTVRTKCLAQEHNTMLEPGSLDPESSALTIRPPRLSINVMSPETLMNPETFPPV